MDKNMELIHKLFDREASDQEERKILDQLNSDPLLKSEFERLRETIHIIENCERKSVPPSFTSEVMKRLPVHEKTWKERIRDFFLKERVFRWNVATATATVFFVLITLIGIFQIQKKHTLISYPAPRESTITVNFNFYAPKAKKVSIAGDFNKWSVDDGIMRKQSDSIWTIEVQLKPGTHNYMFVVDGEKWVTDPNADSYRDDGFGYKNSVVRVNNL